MGKGFGDMGNVMREVQKQTQSMQRKLADLEQDLKDRIAYKNIIPLIQKCNPGWQLPDAPPASPGHYEPQDLWAVNPENPVRLTVDA